MNFSIGLSGLQVAQRAIELIGTNISNVSTEGYHRQNALIEPFETDRASGVPIGGARVKGYQRAIDTLLEKQILTQNPQLSQLSQEIMTLRGVESSFGSLDTEGLGSELTKFFGALRELSGNPTSQSLREQAVWAADSLASTFRHIGGTLNDLDRQALTGAQSVIAEVNALALEIAELNGEIQTVSLAGGNPNLMADKRDQAVLDLAELVEVDTVVRDDGTGVVDILIWGTPLVVTDHAVEMEVGALSDGKLGLSVKDASSHDSDIRGGKLGALFALRNDIIEDIQTDLDALAGEVMLQLNKLHLQGVGTSGSHDGLTGVGIADPAATLDGWAPPIVDGEIHLRLVDTTGAATNRTVTVDASVDTMTTIANKLNALDPTHLSASTVGGALRMEGLAGYTFDFLPAPSAEVGAAWTGTSSPTEAGAYTGAMDETYTFTVVGAGAVGVQAGLAVEARNRAGALVATLDVGNTYIPGTALAVEEGLTIGFGAGELADAEQFTVEAVADGGAGTFTASTPWNGTTGPELSGIYEGPANETFTFSVQSGGQIGVDADVAIQVRNGANELVTTLEVGNGYAAGDKLEVYKGLYVSFDVGSAATGERFEVEALVDSDPTGFLAGAGIGTLFEGADAATMAVRESIVADPGRLATAHGAEMVDNTAIRKMADLGEAKLAALNGATASEAFRVIVGGVGQRIAIRQARHDAIQNVMHQLINQRETVSGVDLNDEAAKLLIFEKMFQGMAKFLGAQKEALETLINLL